MTRLSLRQGGASGAALLVAFFGAGGCEPKPAPEVSGAQVDEVFAADGRSCGRGLVVSLTDYQSSNVALIDLEGKTLSPSLLSSGSEDPKLSAPLTEAVFPTSRAQSDVVILDRYPASVLTFVSPEAAEVKTQIAVRTGFNSNPQDFLDVGDGRALVSRLEKNPEPGREPFDGGDDLLWLDVSRGAITGRIDLSAYADEETGRVRPSQMILSGETIFLTLTGHDATFQMAGIGRVMALDRKTGDVLAVHELSGLKNCVGLALGPDGKSIALSCSDLIDESGADAPTESGVVVFSFERAGDEVKIEEVYRLLASDLGFGPFSGSIAFAKENLILVGLYGALEGEDAGRPDRIVSIDTAGGAVDELLRSEEEPFTLGDVRCAEPCAVCFVADAGRDLIHRYELLDGDEGLKISHSTHRVESEIGLPPRSLGQF